MSLKLRTGRESHLLFNVMLSSWDEFRVTCQQASVLLKCPWAEQRAPSRLRMLLSSNKVTLTGEALHIWNVSSLWTLNTSDRQRGLKSHAKNKKINGKKRNATHWRTFLHTYTHVGKTKCSQVIWQAVKCQHRVSIGAVIWTEPAPTQTMRQRQTATVPGCVPLRTDNTHYTHAGPSGCCQILTQWCLSVSFFILIHHRLVYRKRFGLISLYTCQKSNQ